MFMGTVYPESAFDGAIMLTASHLPMDRNGMKFFTREGGLDKPDIKALLTAADKLGASQADAAGEPFDLMTLYTADLRDKIAAGVAGANDALPLAGLHVAVDCGNGAGGFFVERVLKPLGADTAGSRYLEPDGTFPNHIPNPENKEAMDACAAATVESGADLGLIFDTDVDRMSAVLPD
jgi:phosphomannomutase